MLELLGEALAVAGLDADDQRLHLGIQAAERCLHVTVVQRYVAWAFGGSRRGFGLILDDAMVRARAIMRAPQHAWGGSFKEGNGREARPTLKVTLEHLDAR